MNGDWMFPLIVAQTLQVTLLAGVVFGLTKYFANDRPHLAHGLWALVLLKCLTPPLFASPTSVFSWLPPGYAVIASQPHQPFPENARSSDSAQQSEGIASVLEPVSRKRNGSDLVEPFSGSFVSTVASKVRGISPVSIAIYIWIMIAACVFTVNVLRLWIFLRRVEKATSPTSPKLSRLVQSVSVRVGLRRKIQIRTVDAAIGPAVVGLIWPTVLLPKAIVDGKSDAELEPLLAHELIHIRRGDLVWAILQGLSVSLWWFNPLVWLAERLLTREAERCCDEETIAGLGCSPAVYARSLLDVMERKHQLRAAPLLPGVRPVDITAKRLERIMRLGQGSYRQRPWWVVVVWLMGCAIVLPGAAWVAAQEKLKQEIGQQSSGPLPNARASNAVQTAATGKGLRIAVPALGPAPLAFDFVYPQTNTEGSQTQTGSFFMGFTTFVRPDAAWVAAQEKPKQEIGQQSSGPLPNARASNAVQTAAPGIGLRVAVPALGPAPLAFDFAFPLKNACGDQTQTFSVFTR